MPLPRFSVLRAERRKTRRDRKHCIVRVKVGENTPLIRGVLSDLSKTGACLTVSIEDKVPPTFTLNLPGKRVPGMPPRVALGATYRR